MLRRHIAWIKKLGKEQIDSAANPGRLTHRERLSIILRIPSHMQRNALLTFRNISISLRLSFSSPFLKFIPSLGVPVCLK